MPWEKFTEEFEGINHCGVEPATEPPEMLYKKFTRPASESVTLSNGTGKIIYFGLENALSGDSTGTCFDANFFSQYNDIYLKNKSILPDSLRKKVRILQSNHVSILYLN